MRKDRLVAATSVLLALLALYKTADKIPIFQRFTNQNEVVETYNRLQKPSKQNYKDNRPISERYGLSSPRSYTSLPFWNYGFRESISGTSNDESALIKIISDELENMNAEYGLWLQHRRAVEVGDSKLAQEIAKQLEPELAEFNEKYNFKRETYEKELGYFSMLSDEREKLSEAAILARRELKLGRQDYKLEDLMRTMLETDQKVYTDFNWTQIDRLLQEMDLHPEMLNGDIKSRRDELYRRLVEYKINGLSEIPISFNLEDSQLESLAQNLENYNWLFKHSVDMIHHGIFMMINSSTQEISDILIRRNSQLFNLKSGHDFQYIHNFTDKKMDRLGKFQNFIDISVLLQHYDFLNDDFFLAAYEKMLYDRYRDGAIAKNTRLSTFVYLQSAGIIRPVGLFKATYLVLPPRF